MRKCADGCEKNGRNPEPSAGIIDSQRVKGTSEPAEESGFDGYKKVKRRKHHLVTDTGGCVLAVGVHVASVHDSLGSYGALQTHRQILRAAPAFGRPRGYETRHSDRRGDRHRDFARQGLEETGASRD